MLGGFSLISIQTLLHDSSRKEERIEKQRPGIKYRPLILKPSTTEAQDKSIQVATGPLVQKAPTVEALYFSASHIRFLEGKSIPKPLPSTHLTQFWKQWLDKRREDSIP